MNLLSEIVSSKQRRVDQAKNRVSLEQMRALASEVREDANAHALLKALSDESKINIIAEFKRRSPSKGELLSISVIARAKTVRSRARIPVA